MYVRAWLRDRAAALAPDLPAEPVSDPPLDRPSALGGQPHGQAGNNHE